MGTPACGAPRARTRKRAVITMSFKASILALTLGTFSVFGFGCMASSTDSGDDPEAIGSQAQADKGGCHVECPKCRPGEICPLIACRLICPQDKKDECTTDADCSLAADYCTGCDCRALASG